MNPGLRAALAVLVYASLAWPASWLALPPGYAAPFAPAAGAAVVLASRWRYAGVTGVTLGAALVAAALDTGGGHHLTRLSVGIGLGLAAGLQALVAWRMSRALRARLEDGWDIARLFAITGPIACVVTATAGVPMLVAAGRLDLAAAPGTWIAWWAGQVAGVWTVLPIALAWPGERRVAVTAPMVLASVALVSGHVAAQAWELQRSESSFRTSAYAVETALTTELLRQEEAIRGLARALEGQGTPSPSRFSHLARPLLERLHSLQAVEWVPVVPVEEIDEVLTVFSRRLGATIPLRRLGVVAGDEHVHPVLYIEPTSGNEAARGLDLGSEPTRREVLHVASTWQSSALSGALTLVQKQGDAVGVLWAAPVIEDDVVRAHVVGVLHLPQLFDTILRVLPTGVSVRLLDDSADGGVLASRGAWPDDPPFVASSRRPLGHRIWRVELAPTPAWNLEQRTFTSAAVVLGGLALAGLLGGMLLLLTGQATSKARLADDLERRNVELEFTNEELDRFVWLASHDLKAPARALRRLAGFVREDVASEDPEVRGNLNLMEARAARLERMLDDLLDYARAGRKEVEVEQVDLADMLQHIRMDLRPARGVQIELVSDVERFETARVPLERVLANLVANAIKHHPDPDWAKIEVRCEDRGELLRFTVEDDGKGIPERDRERALQIFQTLQPRDTVESSGVGLALVRRLVERNGGELRLGQSGLGGLQVRFSWPRPRSTPA